MRTAERPLVSVVTPVYNTGEHLAECIESVLAQTHQDWEHLICDNASTDATAEIAASYAARDPRIRHLRFQEHLPQMPNYNRALRQASGQARYVKVIQADDWMFPECLERMVDLAESHPRVGLVGCYQMRGRSVGAQALSLEEAVVAGPEACRRHLLTGRSPFGSPSSVLYRAEEVRARDPFYREDSLLEDTQACYEVLRTTDFGFVHQILVYVRVDNPSITAGLESFGPYLLHEILLLEDYGPLVLAPGEVQARRRELWARYREFLASEAFTGREEAFWDYHARGWRALGRELDAGARRALWWEGLFEHLGNPLRSWRRLRRRGEERS